MNLILSPSSTCPAPTTMSSREIAELTGKRHDHVLRDIKAMLLELDPDSNGPNFGGVYVAGNGEKRPCYELPKRETLILVSGYSVPLRARIVDRWQELEAQQSAKAVALLPNFADPAEAARAWALAYEEKKKAEVALEVAAPKALAWDTVVHDQRSTITEVARVVKQTVCRRLNLMGVKKGLMGRHLYRSPSGRTRVYQNGKSDRMFYEGREDAYGKRDIFCTPLGVAEIRRLAEEGLLPMTTTGA